MRKKISFVIVLAFGFLIGMPVVFAAPSVATSVSSGSIETGSSVTFYVTIRNVASWNIKMNGIGSTTNCSSSYADATGNGNNTNKTFSITCKGSDIGLISFSVSGDATSQDGSNVNVSGSKRVNVTAVKPKSTNNYLKSITVGEYALTPAFTKETLEYQVTVPSTVNSINLEASPEDGTASISGTGEKEVEEGANTFEIRVNAQNGDERIYKVTVQVEDQNPIQVVMDGETYTVVKNPKNITKPDLYEASTITINGMEVPSYVSDVTEYTLVALKNSKGEIVFAIYDEKNGTYQLYEEQKSNSLILYLLDFEEELAGYLKSTITLHNRNYVAYKVNEDSDYAIVYAMNVETGEKNYYLYHAKDNTYQLYFDEMVKKLEEEKETYKYVIMGFAGGCVVLILLCLVGFLRKPNKKLLKRIELMEAQKKHEVKEDKSELDSSSTSSAEITVEPKEKSAKKAKKKKKAVVKEEKKDLVTQVEMEKKSSVVEEVPEVLEVDEAIHKMNDAEEVIREFEKTMALSKEELKKAKEKDANLEKKERSTKEIEETMYDLFEEEHKTKKRK